MRPTPTPISASDGALCRYRGAWSHGVLRSPVAGVRFANVSGAPIQGLLGGNTTTPRLDVMLESGGWHLRGFGDTREDAILLTQRAIVVDANTRWTQGAYVHVLSRSDVGSLVIPTSIPGHAVQLDAPRQVRVSCADLGIDEAPIATPSEAEANEAHVSLIAEGTTLFRAPGGPRFAHATGEARVDVLERRGNLAHVRWSNGLELTGWVPAAHLREVRDDAYGLGGLGLQGRQPTCLALRPLQVSLRLPSGEEEVGTIDAQTRFRAAVHAEGIEVRPVPERTGNPWSPITGTELWVHPRPGEVACEGTDARNEAPMPSPVVRARLRVTSSTTSAAPAASLCDVDLSRAGPGGGGLRTTELLLTRCKLRVKCGGEVLVGEAHNGFFDCEIGLEPRRFIRGHDDLPTSGDNDASFAIDTEAGTLRVADDRVSAGAYSLEGRLEDIAWSSPSNE